MGFLNPKQMDEDDELPGSGLHLDLEAKVCPICRRSALPWQERCEDCDEPVVAPGAVPAQEFALPDLAVEDPDDAPTDDATPDEATPDEATPDDDARSEGGPREG